MEPDSTRRAPQGWGTDCSAKQIFMLAFAARVLFAVLVFAVNPERLVGTGGTFGGDGVYYDILAVNLWHHGTFSASLAPPYVPDMLRVPGYTTFLALVYAVFGHLPRLVVFWQLVLSALSCVLAWRLGALLTGEPRIAMIAALLLTFDMSSVLAAQELWSETLFALLLVLNLTAVWGYRQEGGWSYLLAAGFWLGLAALFRPEAAGFALVEAALLVAWPGPPWRRPLAGGAVFLGVVVLLLAPWLGRNWYHFRVLALSSVSSNTLLFENAELVEAFSTGRPRHAVRREFRKRIAEYRYQHDLPAYDHPATMAAKGRLAWHILRDNPGQFLRLQLESGFAVWLPHIPGLLRVLGYPNTQLTYRWEAWREEGWPGVWQVFREHWLRFVPWPIMALGGAWSACLLLVYLAALRGYLMLARSKSWAQLILLVLPLLYFVMAVQAVVLTKTPRHLVPLMPYVLIAAAIGLATRSSSPGGPDQAT